MRPIVTTSDDMGYSKDDQLNKSIIEESQGDNDGPKRKRRKLVTVETVITEFETLLTEHWDPDHRWDANANRLKAQRLKKSTGTGFVNATQQLIQQTGQYCAYCDAPIFSDLLAAPILPLEWFPAQAFDDDKLVLTCSSCRAILDDNGQPQRDAGDVDYLERNYAWPHLFWRALQDGSVLPCRYELVQLPFVEFGQPVVTPIQGDGIGTLLKYYRLGYVGVNRSDGFPGKVIIKLPDQNPDEPVRIASWVSPTTYGLTTEHATGNLITLLRLNDIGTSPESQRGLDRRVELRTMAHLKALDFLDRLLIVQANQDLDLFNRLQEILVPTIRATGFWGVWLSVFRSDNGIQQLLANMFKGTAPTIWTVS